MPIRSFSGKGKKAEAPPVAMDSEIAHHLVSPGALSLVSYVVLRLCVLMRGGSWRVPLPCFSAAAGVALVGVGLLGVRPLDVSSGPWVACGVLALGGREWWVGLGLPMACWTLKVVGGGRPQEPRSVVLRPHYMRWPPTPAATRSA